MFLQWYRSFVLWTIAVLLYDTYSESTKDTRNPESKFNTFNMQQNALTHGVYRKGHDVPTFLPKDVTQDFLSPHGEKITLCKEYLCPDQKLQCYCDDLCVHYGDCCSNAYALKAYMNRTKNLMHSSLSLQSAVLADYSHCWRLRNGTNYAHFQVVDTCPEGTLNENASKCLSNDGLYVSHMISNNTQIVFNNKNCAYCHGLSDDQFLVWIYGVKCPDSINNIVPGFNNFHILNCSQIFLLTPYPVDTMRFCPYDRLESCGRNAVPDDVNAYYYDMCLLYLNPVADSNGSDKITFRNSHCRLCYEMANPHKTSVDQCFTSKSPESYVDEQDGLHPSSHIVNLNILLTFDVNSNSWQKHLQKIPTCYGSMSYNYTTKKCELLCPDKQKVEMNRCVTTGDASDRPSVYLHGPGNSSSYLFGSWLGNHSAFSDSSSDQDSTVVLMSNSSKRPLNDVTLQVLLNHTNRNFTKTNLVSICSEIQSMSIFNLTHRLTIFELEHSFAGNIEMCRYKLNVLEDTVFPNIIQGAKQLLKNISKVDAQIYLSNFVNVTDVECSSDQRKIIADNLTLSIVNETFVVDLSDVRDSVDLTDTAFKIAFSEDMETPVIETVIYCTYNIPIMLNCTKMTYKQHDYVYTEQNNTVFLVKEQRYLTAMDEFAFIRNYLVVCVNQSNEEYPSYDEIIGWVGAGTMSLSCLSLLCLICLHIVIKDLRNLHGKCILSFSISLLIAQLDFLLNVILLHKFELACKLSAILDHYAWLCTFAWNGVMAYDVARRFSVFSSLSLKLDDGTDSYRFLRYSLFSWIMPLIFISVINAIDQIFNGHFLEYGSGQVCWITNLVGKLTTFCLPLVTLLCFALICFLISMHGIEYSSRAGILRGKTRTDRNRCIIYTKISIFLGLTWIVGYMEVFTKMKIFEYMNVIINGLQGFILLISVLINSKLITCGKQRESNAISKSDNSSSKP